MHLKWRFEVVLQENFEYPDLVFIHFSVLSVKNISIYMCVCEDFIALDILQNVAFDLLLESLVARSQHQGNLESLFLYYIWTSSASWTGVSWFSFTSFFWFSQDVHRFDLRVRAFDCCSFDFSWNLLIFILWEFWCWGGGLVLFVHYSN